MFVVTEPIGAANSGGVLCSGPSSSAKRFTQQLIQQIGTFRSYGAKPRDPVDCYKHCIPTGFFVRLIVLVRNKVLQTCYAKKHSNQVTSSGVALLCCYFTSMSPLVPVSTC